MDREPDWNGMIARIDEAFERGDAERLGPLLRQARRSCLPPIPDSARRLLVIQGLERAERCAAAGRPSLARVEFARAVARAGEGQTPPPHPAAPSPGKGRGATDPRGPEVCRC